MRETYAYVVLERKTKRLRKETNNPHLRSALDSGRGFQLFEIAIVRPLKLLFLSPIVFLMSFYMATVYGYLYLLFTTFSRVFGDQYVFSETNIGLTYLGVGLGSFLGLVICGGLSDKLVASLSKRHGGLPKPEYRLPTMFGSAFIVPVGLFLYGWSAEEKVHWIVPIIGTVFLGGGLFGIMVSILIFPNTLIGQIQKIKLSLYSYPQQHTW